VLRPFLWWAATILIAAIFYLGQHNTVADARAELQRNGSSYLAAYGKATYAAARDRTACVSFLEPTDKTSTYVGGLPKLVREATSAPAEALQLAFRNGFIVLEAGGEGAHRSYGCLYGVELYGGSNPVAYVPSAISAASAIQKLFSSVFIFLFALALRNMLKMK
jgi:hypothetical protein